MLDATGASRFWKVRMKPGMPVLFGDLDRARFLVARQSGLGASRPTRRSGAACSTVCRALPKRAAVFRHAVAPRSTRRIATREFVRGRLDGRRRRHAAHRTRRRHRLAPACAPRRWPMR
jgi:molybdopterin molybdotransferase